MKEQTTINNSRLVKREIRKALCLATLQNDDYNKQRFGHMWGEKRVTIAQVIDATNYVKDRMNDDNHTP